MLKVRVGDFVIGERERAAINAVLDSGRLSEGRNVLEFEKKWAGFIGTKYALAVNSGTSALILALAAANQKGYLKNNAKIITTPLTYIATTNAIVSANMQPVYADINPVTFDIDPDSVRKLLEESKEGEYSALLPVHLMGYPCNMDSLTKLCKEHNILLFEDSAQAHGTLYHGKRTGSFGIFGAFSFYIAHNIQAGELGAITTDDYEFYKVMKKMKANGRACDCEICTRSSGFCKQLANYDGEYDFDPRFSHDMFGYNFKTMEFPAALALAQMETINDILRKRRENVMALNRALSQFSGILQLPKFQEDISYLAYPLVIKQNSGFTRKHIRQELEKRGIETRPLFGCIPTQQQAYAHLKKEYEGKLPNAEYIGANGFYIGCHQYISPEDIDYIAKCFEEILS
ncbi:MAG: DegT/DnrJ/EryC1/StrS family aminotransferase [Nanoarchaeota archaeon]|nr:DegT/DnrJ/EryC1/StrS family aminotransferase [Nanoarchaeota archaeon]